LTFFPSGDFVVEIWGSLRFYFTKRSREDRETSVDKGYKPGRKVDFAEAFGVARPRILANKTEEYLPARASYDEDVRLEPYGYRSEQGGKPQAQ
jgi:hypothetical protein